MGKKRPVIAPDAHSAGKKAKVSQLGTSGFNQFVGGDAAVTAFLSSWEESEPCYIEAHLTKFPPLPKLSELKEIVKSGKLSFGRDIFVTTWDGDVPEFGT
jgi:hypothetical protein